VTDWLSDDTVDHLRRVADWPDLTGTRYDIVEKIGAGGMGTVYEAEDHELRRRVALKILSDPSVDRGLADRMLEEARIIAQLEHPGIVPVHDVGRLPDGRIFYVMKRIRGRRLDEHVEGARSVAQRLRIFERICEAVAFAHAHGVIHRDLKPQNVMLGAFGEVLVLDWGVAKVLAEAKSPTEAGTPAGAKDAVTDHHADDDPAPTDDDPTHDTDATVTHRHEQTIEGTVIGTPAYMAPEQARGQVSLVDERSDVYALGAILYFLLTGRAPMPESTPAVGVWGRGPTSRDVNESDIIPPRRLERTIPKSLNAICMKALSPNPDDRYNGAEALSEDVRRHLSAESVSAYRENLFERCRRFVSKYRTAVLLVLAYLLMRVGLIFFGGS
jgi:serine/threonine protein kinase